ncbi:hypothetical protein Mpop_2706 [Methylorubrum populi BJ001]|jgi:hypothetical protein|uniref:Uncharacterized protein n=1 Tax=Methylorubrum populi (strain ATCC BAA-705 / NCIMB 13946 / BJ001) TaxID=441620 RepID=B1ZCZ2_METPB|nr:hypothetical protein [Methylorubrum populi]ACB80861.1 hypothetical protein Mpop_2706 [Methylorubrum populi BJ001]
MRIGLPLCIALGLVASAAPASATFTRQIAADHAQFAACAFQVLDQAYPSMVRLTDLRGADTIKIVMEETAVGLVSSATNRFVDMDVRRAGKGTSVTIKSAWSLLGDDYYAERTWKEISSCAR